MKIGIIGGGPAGMLAAIEASKRYPDVTLIDWNLQLGRKLASTGGGRGNLTNVFISPEAYEANEKFSFFDIIHNYNYQFINDYFLNIGIYTYHTDDGWVYPISNSAKNISEYLAAIISINSIKVMNDTLITSIRYKNNEFLLKSERGNILTFDKIIIATGGKAYPKLRSSDLLLNILQQLGHEILPPNPALAPFKTTKMNSDKLNGVRLNAKVVIKQNETVIGSEFGNIIFTEWGINGPGVMNLSHRIHNLEGELKVLIKFNYDEVDELINFNLLKYQSSQIPLKYALNPFFPAKIIDQIIKNSNFPSGIRMSELSNNNVSKILEKMTIEENLLGTRDFTYSQISTGSVCSGFVNPQTLESTIIPGLFFAGEILDVIGPCGGYNLHWAFVSGIVAGNCI